VDFLGLYTSRTTVDLRGIQPQWSPFSKLPKDWEWKVGYPKLLGTHQCYTLNVPHIIVDEALFAPKELCECSPGNYVPLGESPVECKKCSENSFATTAGSTECTACWFFQTTNGVEPCKVATSAWVAGGIIFFLIVAVLPYFLWLRYAKANAATWVIQQPETRALVLQAVSHDGMALRHAAKDLRRDAAIVVAAVKSDGMALQYADGSMKQRKHVVLHAVSSNRAAVKFAAAKVAQLPEVLAAAGLGQAKAPQHFWMATVSEERKPPLVLSIKFEFEKGADGTDGANGLKLLLSEDPDFKDYYVHFPNAYDKGFCGTKDLCETCLELKEEECWCRVTDMTHPCRGFCDVPDCWRRSFRNKLIEARKMKGVMIQLKEGNSLGGGQRIESQMAAEEGTAVVMLDLSRTWFAHEDMLDLKTRLREIGIPA